MFQDEEEGAMVTYNNSKVVEVINKIKQNNLNSTEFYEITFTEDLNIIGKDIELGGNTYEYIKINAPLTNSEEGKKEITTNIFDKESNVKIEIEGEEKSMVKFDFNVINYVYDGTNDVPSGMNNVPFDIFVLEEDADALQDYLLGPDLQLIQEKADNALKMGESWSPNSYACNNTVRAYLYYLKNDVVLFPVTDPDHPNSNYGSGLEGPNGPTVFKGEISWAGTANKIYVDLENNELTEYFTEITKSSTQTWNVFFNNIQDKANSGEIIIAVIKRSSGVGHILAFMPKSLYSGSNEAVLIGDDRGVIKPIALEGGGDIKEIKPFIGTNTEITRSTNPYRYYKYIKK